LSHLKTFSRIGAKMKFVPFFNIYNFDFMTKAKFLIDFELQNQSQCLTQNPNFWGIIFKAKF